MIEGLINTFGVFAWATLYARTGWKLGDEWFGDTCIDGRPDRYERRGEIKRNPFPQLRDILGLVLAIVALITASLLYVATGMVKPVSFVIPSNSSIFPVIPQLVA